MEYIFGKSQTFQNLEYTVDVYTKLLLYMDGANDSTTFTDSGVTGHTVTAAGDAKLKTAVKKFGTASGFFDGSGDYLSIPDSADWNVGSGRFTADFWVRFDTVSKDQCFFAQRSGGDSFQLELDHANNLMRWWVYSGSVEQIRLEESWDPSINTWYHVALIRGWSGNANSWSMCVDGTSIGSLSDSTTIPDSSGVFKIGQSGYGTGDLSGYVDVFRWSKGIARWTSNFTPPIFGES